MALIRERGRDLVDEYLAYKAHVSEQSYADLSGWEPTRRAETEEHWPEYKNTCILMSRPAWLYRRSQACIGSATASMKSMIKDGTNWLRQYVPYKQRLQEMKQHHVHIMDEKGVRRPLTSCRRRDKPAECKGGFPQTMQTDPNQKKAVVVCEGLAKKMHMPHQGRRNKIGSLHGPQNEANLDGTHGALLVAGGFNTDVQIGYRLPIMEETHCANCTGNCVAESDLASVAAAAQVAQDAQVGYSCDYQNKRNPIAVHEVKEFMKGHSTLHEQLQGEPVGYMGRRHAQRLISDFYAKGICRGAVECVNLLTHSSSNDVTAAETIKTARSRTFFGGSFLRRVEHFTESHGAQGVDAAIPVVDDRNPHRKKITFKDADLMYGCRGTDQRVHHLSPFEFTRYWQFELLKFPRNVDEENEESCRVRMEKSGGERWSKARIQASKSISSLAQIIN